MKRREFIKTSIGATSGVIFINSFLGCVNPALETGSLDDIYRGFQNPPIDSRVFVRWWWNGNRLTKKEILRELDVMKAAGIGGVEINPIAMPDQVENPPEGLVWLSEEWCEMIIHAANESRRLGLVADLIVGTGWPFGGEFIEPEETLQGMVFETMELEGPGSELVKIDMPANDNEKIINIILIPVGLKDIEKARVMINELKDNGDLLIDLDTGKYALITVRWRNKFRTVYHGSPGGAGSVLDHFNQHAVRKYLLNMSDKLKPFLKVISEVVSGLSFVTA